MYKYCYSVQYKIGEITVEKLEVVLKNFERKPKPLFSCSLMFHCQEKISEKRFSHLRAVSAQRMMLRTQMFPKSQTSLGSSN